MRYFFAALVALAMNSSAIRSEPLFQGPNKRLLNLEKQKAKLKTQSDPVDHAKTDIKISEILLSLVSDDIKAGNMEEMKQRLEEYVATIRDAHDTLLKTGRDAHKKPSGFKDLEIALRRQLRQLDDLGGSLTFDQRDPVTKAHEQASEVRDDMLKALFGSQNVTPRKS